MKIGLDMDEVLAEFMGGFCEFYNSKFSTDISSLNLKRYAISPLVGGTHEDGLKLVDDFHDSEFFDRMTLVEGAREALSLLGGHELIVVTARPRGFKEKTDKFLKTNFPDNTFRVFYSSEVHGHEGTKTKEEICNELGIKILVEDNGEYAPKYARSGIKVLLLDKPWNRDCEEHENIIRVSNWDEVVEKINEFEKMNLEFEGVKDG